MAWDRLMEAQLLPLSPTPVPEPAHALVLAPHPDDEIFGCGGLLRLWAQSQVPVSVHILTDGESWSAEGAQLLRREESRTAAAVIGHGLPHFWGLPDRGLRYGEGLVRRLVETIKDCGADWILAPALSEIHPDHQVLGLAAAEAVRRLQGERVLAFYEVSAPLQPNALIDISSVEKIKDQAMRCFRSQEAVQPYSERIRGLNRYRAYSLGAQCYAAEAFFWVHARDLAFGLQAVPRSWRDRRAACAGALDAADVPMVSVVVRSMDRSVLHEALQSIADQTYPNIQVVVVNAKGGDHSPVTTQMPHWDWVFVDSPEPLPRSRAANVGLRHAQGRWILFLDDDDLLLPDHIHKLVQALICHPSHWVAYSDVRVVDQNLSPLFDYDWPYCFERLVACNYIPNMAVLFDRVLVGERGCCFDESLSVLEDWDFLLQLAQHTDFVHVPGVSAVYRFGLGQSGLSQGLQEALYRRQRAEIAKKWYGVWGTDVLDAALEVLSREANLTRMELKGLRLELEEARRDKATTQARCEEALAQERRQRMEQEATIERLESVMRAVQGELDEACRRYDALADCLQAIESSRVWKATYPVRYCLAKVKKALGLL